MKGLGCDPDSANGGAKGIGRGRGRGGSSGERLVETEVSLKIGNMKKKKQWIFIMLQSCLQMDILWAGMAVFFF